MNGCVVAGGSRRRSRKNRKGTKKRRGGGNCNGGNVEMKGGMYGFGGPLAGTTAGAAWGGVPNNAINSATGEVIRDPTQATPIKGAGRKTMKMKDIKKMLKKNGLKTTGRKSTLLKRMKKAKIMKGGAAEIPVKAATAGFVGTGSRGLADYPEVPGGRLNDVHPLS